jgi:hypothetical protein
MSLIRFGGGVVENKSFGLCYNVIVEKPNVVSVIIGIISSGRGGKGRSGATIEKASILSAHDRSKIWIESSVRKRKREEGWRQRW